VETKDGGENKKGEGGDEYKIYGEENKGEGEKNEAHIPRYVIKYVLSMTYQTHKKSNNLDKE
jgi:hypothetical protein